MAIENPHIHADAVEVQEFVYLAQRYDVFGVPKVVINEELSFEGALPEPAFLLYVLKAAEKLTDSEKIQFEKYVK